MTAYATEGMNPERDVVACVLLGGAVSVAAGHGVLSRARGEGLLPEHFWEASTGALFGLLCAMQDDGLPVDATQVAAEISRRSRLGTPLVGEYVNEGGLRSALWGLAHEVPAFGVVEHRARLVLEDARVRGAA